MSPEANASGKAGGYAGRGPAGVCCRAHQRSTSIMSTPATGVQECGGTFPGPELEKNVHSVQRRILSELPSGENTRKRSPTRNGLLMSSWSAKCAVW